MPGGDAALANGRRDACALVLLAPLQQGDGDDADEEDHTGHETSTAGAAQSLLHVREPERTEESPGGPDDVDEDADAGAVLDVAVDGVGDEDGGDDLVSDGGDGDADDGSHVPFSGGGLLQTHAEEDQADHGEEEADVAEPQSVLGRRASSEFLRTLVHPEIADPATELLADDKTDHDAEELEAELLRVQAELGEEELRNLNGKQNAAESEYDGIGDSRDPDGSVTEEGQGLNEFGQLQWRGVDTLEVEVLLLESGDVVADDIAHVKGLGSEEQVGEELDAVGDCEDPVDPSEVTGVVDDESHEERATGRAHGDKKRPHADVGRTLPLEESLGHDTGSSATRRSNEKRGEGSADCHCCVRVALGTSNVESKGSKSADEPDRSTAVAVGNGFPEQGSPAEDGDLK